MCLPGSGTCGWRLLLTSTGQERLVAKSVGIDLNSSHITRIAHVFFLQLRLAPGSTCPQSRTVFLGRCAGRFVPYAPGALGPDIQ